MELKNGPYPKPRNILAVRELRKEDLARLAEPRAVANVVRRLKDSHHHLARLFASGLNAADVARRVGMTTSRVTQIRKSPAFDQLVAEYRKIATEAWAESVDDYFEIAAGNMVRAELQIADRLGEAEEAGETLPVRDLIAISRDAADRFGYGKRATQVNVNADFASLLEKAIRRSGKLVSEASPPPKAPHSSHAPSHAVSEWGDSEWGPSDGDAGPATGSTSSQSNTVRGVDPPPRAAGATASAQGVVAPFRRRA